MLDQGLLLAALRARFEQAGLRLDDFARLGPEGWEIREAPGDLWAVVVLGSFDLSELVAGAVRFVEGLEPSLRSAWRRAMTRTLFLCGDAARLAPRFELAQVSSSAAMAWMRPMRSTGVRPVSALLRRLVTRGPVVVPDRIECREPPSRGRAVRVCIDTLGLRLEDYLVHLHHLLVEGMIDGHIMKDSPIVLEHRSGWSDVPTNAVAHRIEIDPRDRRALKLVGYVVAA